MKKYILTFASTINIKGIFNTIFSLTGSVFVTTLAISFITFFLVYNPGMIKKLLLELIPNAYFEITVNAFHKVDYLTEIAPTLPDLGDGAFGDNASNAYLNIGKAQEKTALQSFLLTK